MDDLSLVCDHTVLTVVAGSRAYGLATEDGDIAAMTTRLETERDRSSLPERPSAGPALHDLVVRVRLADLPHVNSRSQG